jgi:oligopeptide/dipeptide ABC transporter ATP-binding protein
VTVAPAVPSARDAPPAPLLAVEELSVAFAAKEGELTAVDRVSFAIAPGEVMALVGESGCGKSVTSLAIMGLLPKSAARVAHGAIRLRGGDGQVADLVTLPEKKLRTLRGDVMAMIFQEPMTSLNPLEKVGDQVAEALVMHRGVGWAAARRAAGELLGHVGLPDPEKKLIAYPHELSGGMRQRVMIAMALACRPRLLIADEPTTALDVTVQAQILDLMRQLRREYGMAILFITHDLGVVAEIADRVSVMYAGQIVETGSVRDVLQRPRHPYTRALMGALPRIDRRGGKLAAIPGLVPDLRNIPAGCRYHPRCAEARAGSCDTTVPAFEAAGAGIGVRCLRWRELAAT